MTRFDGKMDVRGVDNNQHQIAKLSNTRLQATNCQLQDTIDTDTSLQDHIDHRLQAPKLLNCRYTTIANLHVATLRFTSLVAPGGRRI